MLLWDSSVYVWFKLTRVTGKVGKCNKDTFASCTSDAIATGLFSDTVTRVGTITVQQGQTKEQAFQMYKKELLDSAESMGYTNNTVLCINRREHKAILNGWLDELDELETQFHSQPYTGERMIKRCN